MLDLPDRDGALITVRGSHTAYRRPERATVHAQVGLEGPVASAVHEATTSAATAVGESLHAYRRALYLARLYRAGVRVRHHLRLVEVTAQGGLFANLFAGDVRELIRAEHVATMIREAVHTTIEHSGLLAPADVEKLVDKSRTEFRSILKEREAELQRAHVHGDPHGRRTVRPDSSDPQSTLLHSPGCVPS